MAAYEVKGIVNDRYWTNWRGEGPQRRWKVSWVGYTEYENTWEPEDNLKNLAYFTDYEKLRLAKNVEKVIKEKTENGIKLWLIKWTGLDSSYNQWEPIERLKECAIFKEYETQKKKGNTKSGKRTLKQQSNTKNVDEILEIKSNKNQSRKRNNSFITNDKQPNKKRKLTS